MGVFNKKDEKPKARELREISERLKNDLNYHLEALERVRKDTAEQVKYYKEYAIDAKIKLDAINKEIDRVKKEG